MALKIYFGGLAVEYVNASGRTIKEVAELIGKTPENQFSKWKMGKWSYIAEEKLLRVIDVVAGKDREKRVALMVAYLIDQTPDVFRPLIDITPRSGAETGKPELTGQRWTPELRRKLEAIGSAYGRDEDLMHIIDTATKWSVRINEKAAKSSKYHKR
jgi:hypothetical protein